MRIMIIVGIALVVLGVVSLAYQGITYTTHEEIVDIGPIEASTETEKQIPLPPVVGGVALAGGTILLLAGAKRRG